MLAEKVHLCLSASGMARANGIRQMGGNACLVWMLNTCEVVEVDDAVAALRWGCAIDILASGCEQRPPLTTARGLRSLRDSCGKHRPPATAGTGAGMPWSAPAAQRGEEVAIADLQWRCLMSTFTPCDVTAV